MQWLLRPGEATRTAAKAAGQAAGQQTAAGALAMAAHYAAGPPKQAKPTSGPPSPSMSAQFVALSVKVSSVRGDAAEFRRKQRAYIDLGVDLMPAAQVV